ncbi:MAG: cation transporter [bacterium]|nr:cation transporter [bacterium]
MTSDVIKVTGMSCDHCKAAVEQALRKVPGTYKIDVNRPAGTAAVEWDESKAPRTSLIEAIVDAGFEAE